MGRSTIPLHCACASALGGRGVIAELCSVRGAVRDTVLHPLTLSYLLLLLQGPWNHAFYLALDAALPPTPDPFTITTLEKVGIDQFVQAPIISVRVMVRVITVRVRVIITVGSGLSSLLGLGLPSL